MASPWFARALRRSGVQWTPRSPGAGADGFYHPGTDTITMPGSPARNTRPLRVHWTGLALHELGHATGHKSRTNRVTRARRRAMSVRDTRREYSREEIVAELISYRVAKRLGIPRRGSPRYVSEYIRQPKPYGSDAVPLGRGGRHRERSPAEASGIMRDVREGEQMLLGWIGSEGFARARPRLGGGG